MSYRVFFAFSTGLKRTIKVPKQTIEGIRRHVREMETALNLEAEQYRDNPKHWTSSSKACEDIDDETLCREAARHNAWVVRLYENLGEWQEKPPKDSEDLTPEIAAEFWHALETIDVPSSRWSKEYFVERMEQLYDVMRGRETDGVSFDAKPLTIKQAEAVITLFGDLLDPGDTRLAVCEGDDALTEGEEYAWCSLCGAIRRDHVDYKIRHCRKRGGCDIRNNYESER